MAGQTEVLAAFQRALEERMSRSRAVMSQLAQEMTAWMRSNARSADNDDVALRELEAVTAFSNETLAIIARSGGAPDYVRLLELGQTGKYAIVRPCIEHFSGRIYRALQDVWA